MLENGTIVPLNALDSVAKSEFQIGPEVKEEPDLVDETCYQSYKHNNQFDPRQKSVSKSQTDDEELATPVKNSEKILLRNENEIDRFKSKYEPTDETAPSLPSKLMHNELALESDDDANEHEYAAYRSSANRPVRKRKIPKKYKDTAYAITASDRTRKRSRSERDYSPVEYRNPKKNVKTLALWDVGISLNKHGEVSLAMPDNIRDIMESGGSININFDVRCLDSDNCLKFKVTDDEDSINTALESETTPKKKALCKDAGTQASNTEKPVEIVITQNDKDYPQQLPQVISAEVETTSVQVSNIVNQNKAPSKDVATQVQLQDQTSPHPSKPAQIPSTGFVSHARFSQAVPSSTVTIHKVLLLILRYFENKGESVKPLI